MEEENGLKELLQSATVVRPSFSISPAEGILDELCGKINAANYINEEGEDETAEEGQQSCVRPSSANSKKLLESLFSPLSNEQHAGSLKRQPGEEARSLMNILKGGNTARTNEPEAKKSQAKAGAPNVIQSLQELRLDAIKTKTMAISQVKQAGRSRSEQGRLIAVTRHCIAYVLNERKIRIIGQENGATGLMDLHDPMRIPIVDIAWNRQDYFKDSQGDDGGLHSIKPLNINQHLLASLTAGGEVCIGAVYAESNTTLAYEPISATTFPELKNARGLAWSNPASRENQSEDSYLIPATNPLLAVYGSGPEVFLLSVQQPTVRSAALITQVSSVRACLFNHSGSQLYIAGQDTVVIVSVKSIEETFSAQTIALPKNAQRIWLHSHGRTRSIFAVCVLADEIEAEGMQRGEPTGPSDNVGTRSLHSKILIIPLSSDEGSSSSSSEIIISMSLPDDSCDALFTQHDQVTDVLCIGSLSSNRLICVNLSNFYSPIVSSGTWPNDSGSVSVVCAGQLHSVFSKMPADNRPETGSSLSSTSFSQSDESSSDDMFLYVYHTESVKLHRLKVDWGSTRSADEPEPVKLPIPSGQILRPRSSASSPKPRNVSTSSEKLSKTPPLFDGAATTNMQLVRSTSVEPSQKLLSSQLSSSSPQQFSNVSRNSVGSLNNPSSTAHNVDANKLLSESIIDRLVSEQSKQLKRERREMELIEQRRHQEILSITAQGIQQAVAAHLPSAIQQETSRIMDARLTGAIDSVMKNIDQNILSKAEVVFSKQHDSIIHSISKLVTPTLADHINRSIRESVENRLLSGLQSVMTDLVGQLSANISQAIVDSTVEHYKHLMEEMDELRRTVIELQHRTFKLPTAQELAQTVSNEIRHSLSPVTLSHSTSSVGALTNAPIGELESLISSGQYDTALVKALNLGDLAILNWILPRLDVTSILDSPKIHPRIIISLAQQLGYDLSTLTEVKLSWLAEIFTIFDANCGEDSECAAQLPAVLEELFNNLRVVFAAAPNPTLQKQIKSVMRLVRMAMATI